jgi:hypothetical protein
MNELPPPFRTVRQSTIERCYFFDLSINKSFENFVRVFDVSPVVKKARVVCRGALNGEFG